MSTKVLVFESDPGFAGELRSELGKLGCSTTVVDDGNVGLQQAAADKPDLILLSIELPRMNGFSVCNKLKKDANLKEVPLIIMSSESSDETFEQHKKLRTRAEDYVHKPIAFGELLGHIQSFVQLATSTSPDGESIVIDDEIEIGSMEEAEIEPDEEGTQVAHRPPMGSPPSARPAPRAAEPVDDDVAAFADAAFGRLTGDESSAAAETKPVQNGATGSVRAPAMTPATAHAATPSAAQPAPPAQAPKRASIAPSSRVPSRPPSGVNIAEYEKLRVELEGTRGRLAVIERDLRDSKDEAEKLRLEAGETDRLRREVDELKGKLASGPKTGGISSREFLDLREALNKKDKEILALREQLSKKDREIFEGQDRLLALDRTKADLDEKLLTLDRELAEMRDKNDALAADKDLAKKASDDFKSRLEKQKAETDSRERLLADLRAKAAEDAAEAAARLAGVRADADQTLANERADQAKALDQAEERRKADVDQARRDRDAALTDAREAADRDKQEALSAQSGQLKQDHDAKLAALYRAHQQELEKVRSEATQASRDAEAHHVEALAAAKREGEDLATAARAEAEKSAQAALEALRSEHAEKLSSIENDRDSRITALEAKAARETGDANEKMAKLDMDLSATRGELSDLREAKQTGDAAAATKAAELEKSLAETTASREELQGKLSVARDSIASLEAEGASARQELSETKQKLAQESSRAERAKAKWESDRQSLDRAKDALAAALAQIEEAESRPI